MADCLKCPLFCIVKSPVDFATVIHVCFMIFLPFSFLCPLKYIFDQYFSSKGGNNIWQPMLKNVKDFCTSHFPVVKFGFVSVAIFNLSQNGFHLCSLNKVSNRIILVIPHD